MTYVHGLVELSSVDDLPCDFDLVVIEVLLDLILVDRVYDWLLASQGQDRRGVERWQLREARSWEGERRDDER